MKKKIIFRSISLALIFFHLFTVVLRDVSFAAPAKASSSSSQKSTQASPSNAKSSGSSAKAAPKDPPDARSIKPAATADNLNLQNNITSSAGFNLAVLQSFQSDPFTGKASFSLPISVSAGRKGIQPNLALTYSSGGPNSILGLGWDLNLGTIERSTKRGVPKYDSTDTFIFNSGSQTELVHTGGNDYRAKLEGAFMNFEFDGTSWIVTDKTGTKYYFGQDALSQQEEGRIFKWCLDKVEDINGNYLTVSYIKDQNQLYPKQIDYTGNENTNAPTFASVVFEYQDNRPDPINSFRNGFKVVTTKRLSDIKANFQDKLLRRYHLEYTLSETNRSFLSSVTQFGSDNNTSLPPVSFEYHRQQGPWKKTDFSIPDDFTLESAEVADVNNDGYQDILRYVSHWGPCWTVLSDKNNHWYKADTWKMPRDNLSFYEAEIEGADLGVRMVDIDFDGWLDIVQMFRNREGNNNFYVFLNNKSNGWAEANFPLPDPDPAKPDKRPAIIIARSTNYKNWVERQGVVFCDLNGDGRMDILQASDVSEGKHAYIFDEKQNKWDDEPAWLVPDGCLDNLEMQVGDLNADGLTDYIIARDGYRAAYLNNGNITAGTSGAWTREPGFDPSSDVNFKDNTSALVDVNADGLADIIIAKDDLRKTYINKGGLSSGNWVEDSSFVLSEGKFNDGKTRLLTANGKGLLDIIRFNDQNDKAFYHNLNDPENLIKISNGIGGSVSVTYKPSTEFDNTGGDGINDLPFPVYVVDNVTLHDSVNPASPDVTTRYEYKGGRFDFAEREFRGFGEVKTIDAEGNYTLTKFHQDALYKGRPESQETRDASGKLYSFVENKWELRPNDNFVYLAASDTSIYDGTDTPEVIHKEFTRYDKYGNLEEAKTTGTVYKDGDKTTQTLTQITEYIYNTSDYIVALPNSTYLEGNDGTTLSKSWFYYDNKANLTKKEDWLKDELNHIDERIATTYTYDPYGNLTSSTNAKGYTTTTTYESRYHLYPVKVTNSEGHTVQTVYYNINERGNDPAEFNDLGLPGQVKYTQDSNNQRTYNIYDTFGRLICVNGPKETIKDPPNVAYKYELNTTPVKITKWVKLNYGSSTRASDYLIVYQFLDGLSRVLQTKLPAQDDPDTKAFHHPRQLISDIVTYDARGRVKEKYLPYFTDKTPDYVSPTYHTPHASFTYDPLGRLTQTTNPDGSYSNTVYSGSIITTIDENGNKTVRYTDAFGRIAKVEEYQGADGRSTIYPYQDYSLYSTTLYEYDELGNLTKVIDDHHNTTEIRYDSFGRKVYMNDPDMGVWSYEYDAVGNLIRQTDAKGQVLRFQYDALNRLIEKGEQLSTLYSLLATYSYDDSNNSNSIGRLSKVEYPDGSTEFFYDELGREVKSIKKVGNGNEEYTVLRSYDAVDNLTKLTYPDGENVTYTYDTDSGQLISVEGNTPYVKNITYYPTGQIDTITYGNDTQTKYTYDPNTLRLTHLVTNSPNGEIQNLEYKFDSGGNISNIIDSVNTATQSFQYDHLGRLIRAEGAYVRAEGAYGSFNYDYDSIGNMTNKEGVILRYGIPGTNRLPHAVTKYADTEIDYDANGNMVKKGERLYNYDVENRLIKVEEEVPDEAEITFVLGPGWNFISFPVLFEDKKISSVLASIEGMYGQVSRYNAETKKFEHYVGNAKYDQFDTIEFGRGYQIYITYSHYVILSLKGKVPVRQSLSLKAGYNLFSSPAPKEMLIEKALHPLKLNLNYLKILYYNNNKNNFQEYSASKKEFSELRPEKSYYIYCKEDTDWEAANPPAVKTTAFTYDGDGGRVKKTSSLRGDAGDEAISTTYIGSLFEKETRINTDGTRISTDTKHIFAGANRVATVSTGQTGSTGITSQTNFYHSDHLGSSNVITDKDGSLIQYCEYTPYGGFHRNEQPANRQTGKPANHYFTGKELDASTGLYFYGARYYDPQLGRFTQPDTIVQAPYDPQSLNRYSYCRNNPINYVDPTGHSWKSFWKKFGSTVLSIVGVVLAPFTAGASLYLTWAATIWSGVQAAQAGQFGAWAAGFAISMALGGILPVGDFANPLMQIGAGALRGAAIGALSGGVASVIGGGSFGAGAAYGAMGGAQGGAISAFASSQQYQNWSEGNGFRSDATVQAEQRQLGKLQEMIDQARPEGGTAGQLPSLGSSSAGGSSLGSALEYPFTTLGKMGLSIGTDYLKADVFPLARAVGKVGGAILTGITLGTDIAQFYTPKTWSMRVHDAALVISDSVSIVSPFLPPAAKPLRWTSTAAHVWDKFTQEQSDRIYGNK